MIVNILNESGYDEALLGLSLSFYDHAIPLDIFWDDEKKERAKRRAKALAFKGGGHNKFLESIQVWVYIQAARSFWSEFDTYRVGISKNSSSTMHTLDKREVYCNDFEPNTAYMVIESFNEVLDYYKNPQSPYYKDITALKNNLPEGWLQERVVNLNYMALQNICRQREGHRLKYWQFFINTIKEQIEHPYYIFQDKNNE